MLQEARDYNLLAIGEYYLTGPEWKPSDAAMLRFHSYIRARYNYLRLNGLTVLFVDDQPDYGNLENLVTDIERNQVLRVSTQNNECPYLPGELNLRRRAMHDYAHYIVNGTQSVYDELRVASREVGEVGALSLYGPELQNIMFSDTVGQLAAYCVLGGEFAPQRLVHWPRATIEDLLTQY